MALIVRHGLQLRLPRLFHAGGAGGGEALFNYRLQDPGMPDREGVSVFYRDEAGRENPQFWVRSHDEYST